MLLQVYFFSLDLHVKSLIFVDLGSRLVIVVSSLSKDSPCVLCDLIFAYFFPYLPRSSASHHP